MIHTAFSFKPANPAVTVSPASGVTPATVTVTVDPTAFSGLNGTQAVDLGLTSSRGRERDRSRSKCCSIMPSLTSAEPFSKFPAR